MDNFTIWVDAPSEALIETPLDDESSCYLRDEILQTQQYVIEKLDEQKTTEQEKGDSSALETTQSENVLSRVAAEAKRIKNIHEEIIEFRKTCQSSELRLISIKNSFPDHIKPSDNKYEKMLLDSSNEISVLQENVANRERTLRKLQEGGRKDDKEEALAECKKFRNMILEAKQKHEQLKALQVSCQKLKAEQEQIMARQKAERESLENKKAALKTDQIEIEKISDECVELRRQLVQLETAQSQSQFEVDQKELENLKNKLSQIRQESEELSSVLSTTNKEAEDARKQLEAVEIKKADNEKRIKEEKEKILELLRRKVEERNLEKGIENQKITELQEAISKETEELEKANEELEKANPTKKSVSELRRAVSTMNTEIRGYEKQIKDSGKENNKLMEKIKEAASSVGSNLAPFDDLNDTAEFFESDYSDQMIQPQPQLEITPIQKRISRDVFTSGPFMTSTPLKASETTVKTRAAARRLERTAAAKTAEIRKKRGGKK